MAIDRSKFKASSVSKIQQVDRDANAAMGKRSGGGRADMLSIEEGLNLFRIYPCHPDGGGEVYAEPVSKVFLPIEYQERDPKTGEVLVDSKGKPKMKVGMKPIFNSKLHSNVGDDLVERYIAMAKQKAELIEDSKQKQEFLDKIYGKYSPNAAHRLPGCMYQQTWVMYADQLDITTEKVVKFGRLEIKKSIKDKMNKVSAMEAAGDPLGVDPFTDVETGLPVIIEYVKPLPGEKKNPADIYGVAIYKQFDKKTKMLKEFPLTDEQLDHFLTFPSLHKLFRNSFTRKDFLMQVEGLERFDEQFDIGIFNTDEFSAVIDELDALFPEDGQPTEEEIEETIYADDDADDDNDADDESDFLDTMNRTELIAFIKKEKMNILVRPSMKEDDIRQAIRDANEAADLEVSNEEPEPEVVEKKEVKTTTISTKDRLKSLRDKIGK